ncbi:MAG: hypothetical protein ACXABD_00930 [Candidatus Thorarchaeota archaeon]|jgi:hypothetical protein
MDVSNNEVIVADASNNEPVIDSSYNRVLREQAYLLHQMTLMVLRQTSYTYEEAHKELIKHRGNYMLVIRNDNGISNSKEEETRTVNQETYKQIRDHMDKGSEQFRRQQEWNEYIRGQNKQ